LDLAVQYLVASGVPSTQLPPGCRLVAGGEAVSFEEPWSFGDPLIARLDEGADVSALKSIVGADAFLVEGILEPGEGRAFCIGAHLMRDPEGFKPYAAGVPGVIKNYGCRYLARGGTVTPVTGSFVPDRAVLMEFPDADEAVAFYFSEAYAPLLKIRLRTTDPRFVLMSKAGAIPDSASRRIAEKLKR
jgi:uncharacterized protein (DUF1330 family)